MKLILDKSNKRDDYHYFSCSRNVTVQIGKSTNKGKYVWSIFHPDIKYAIWGNESDSMEMAKQEAIEWITQWVKEES
jgi:hypothetical protein